MTGINFFKEHRQALFNLYVFPLYQKLSPTQLRCRPDMRLNSIIWNLWHSSRAEDLGINRLVTDGIQVLDEGCWNERLNLSTRQIGTGMTKEEVDQLSDSIDLEAMYSYHQAVYAKTTRIIDHLSAGVLDETLDAALLTRILQDGETLHPAGAWVYDVYLNQTKGWLLLHLGLNHHYFHLGDSLAVLSLLQPSGQ
jgi:hypothetical protein